MKLLRLLVLLVMTATLSTAHTESLLIGPGDELKVEVYDTPEMDQTVRVTDAGEIPLLLVGNVRVANSTPAEAANLIETALKSKGVMVHPQVSVTVQQYATQQVSVMGQVRTPGVYPLTTPLQILTVLANAGGLTDVADRNITIQRHGDSRQTLAYFLSNNSNAAVSNNVLVYPGDTIIVPRAGVIYVLGDVAKPGGYTMSDNASSMTVLEALANAGGADKTAKISNAKLIRKTTAGNVEVPISLGAMQKGKKSDIAMQADDILYVPFSYMKNIAINGTQIVASAASAVIYTHP